jgi:organic radical activating enzyme
MDVVGLCNLKCPSCPVGNTGNINPTGLVDPELFAKIMAKAAAEYNVWRVCLYNWGEPLLHPKLPELVRTVKRNNLYCALSSNLNILRNAEEMFDSNPDQLRISLSGFSQSIYEQGHAKGDIEKVKQNMHELRDAKRRAGNVHTEVHVFYHKYRYNLDEVHLMRDLAKSLGFGWWESWAYYMPLEKVIELVEGKTDAEERRFVESKFALPIAKAVEAAAVYKDEPCRLWEDQIVLDLQGNAILCCGLYDYKANTLGSFLELTPDQLMKSKVNHPTCMRCTSHGIHRYLEFMGHPKLAPLYDQLVAENLRTPPQVQGEQHEKFSLPVL